MNLTPVYIMHYVRTAYHQVGCSGMVQIKFISHPDPVQVKFRLDKIKFRSRSDRIKKKFRSRSDIVQSSDLNQVKLR